MNKVKSTFIKLDGLLKRVVETHLKELDNDYRKKLIIIENKGYRFTDDGIEVDCSMGYKFEGSGDSAGMKNVKFTLTYEELKPYFK